MAFSPSPSLVPKRKKRPISGWLLFDKPLGMGSTGAVTKIKRIFSASKAGHAGTLDPLATGLLPIALGEATKTIPYVLEDAKTYRFTVAWGAQTRTDDLEGDVIKTSANRPSQCEIEDALKDFIGDIWQVPPYFSAIKVNGKRAYDLARQQEAFSLKKRPVHVYRLFLLNTKKDQADFEVHCSKGTYVRSLGRDLGEYLGCYGHIIALRRTDILSFSHIEKNAFISLERLISTREEDLDQMLLPCESPLRYMEGYDIDEIAYQKILNGQKISLNYPTTKLHSEGFLSNQESCSSSCVKIFHKNQLLALGQKNNHIFQPKRVFL